MVNVTTYNITHVFHNPDCANGIGCLYKNLNDVSQGWLFLATIFLFAVIALYSSIKAGNDPAKSSLAVSFMMLFIVTIGYVYELVIDVWPVTFMITVAAISAVLVYRSR